jgi:small ubiquitin-related modifier
MSGNEPSEQAGEAPAEAATSEPITLKVKAQDGSEIFFKIRPSTQLKKLMDSYCQRQGVDPKTVRFLFEGTRINETSTPRELGMQNDDSIDAMVEQRGGLGLL